MLKFCVLVHLSILQEYRQYVFCNMSWLMNESWYVLLVLCMIHSGSFI